MKKDKVYAVIMTVCGIGAVVSMIIDFLPQFSDTLRWLNFSQICVCVSLFANIRYRMITKKGEDK